ncbi:hypothetical protein B0T16DRAFT_329764 [Cercophora newfieldiana]|uniref:MYND-type domain-containing protein n=1 Tax=Cercophora newfieldiana TaxID=92897 RepID=A0AA39Y6Y3_9PEZI|nr:hypothetical protein B0T16DRAFT_329764 [Cercophora newfieldiana]
MEAKVRAFHALPRTEKLPDAAAAVPNHWAFGVCKVHIHHDTHPRDDILLAVHVESAYLNHSGPPAALLSFATAREKAEAALPYLLDAFTDPRLACSQLGPLAPWTWSTPDPAMAAAMGEVLKSHGVTAALCQVGPDFVEPGDATKCHGCGLSHECFFPPDPLKRCARCGEAWYHSRQCQAKHWKYHKPTCRPPVADAAAAALDARDYYRKKAPTDPAACALMSSLRLPDGHPNGGETSLPLHRLILTGQDTPDNMRLLFGPQYERTLQDDHETARTEFLLDPPPGSPWHALTASMHDPSLARSLRPATDAEKQKVEEVREMQALIRKRVGPGKSPTSVDMEAIRKEFKSNWSDKLPIYTLAKNTMDQGFPHGG